MRPKPACSSRNASKPDRKSTRLNSSHLGTSYAVFCLKKKNQRTPAISRRIVSAARRAVSPVRRLAVGRRPLQGNASAGSSVAAASAGNGGTWQGGGG